MVVPMALDITAVKPDPALFDLPWQLPLEDWPEEHLAALPRGISRHVVRFVRLSGQVIAIKEIDEKLARREFLTLRNLRRIDLPAVEPLGVVSGRTAADGSALDACLVTRHLRFSLPYRAVFSQRLRPDTARRTLDALAVGGHARAATARFTLRFRATGARERVVVVRGRLFLSRRTGSWQVFGYDVKKWSRA